MIRWKRRLRAGMLLPSVLGLLALLPSVGRASADAGRDRVLHRVSLPSNERREAEVRVVDRDGVVLVQTVIHSKVLRRVVGKIADKEARHWPPDREGHEDAERYLSAIKQVLQQIRQQPRSEDAPDRRRTMLIEFQPGADGGVLISGARVAGTWDDLRVERLLPPTTRLELTRSYVETNMQLIVSESFAVQNDEARSMLEDIPR